MAAMICVGAAFALNGNSSKPQEDKAAMQQENGSGIKEDAKEENPEAADSETLENASKEEAAVKQGENTSDNQGNKDTSSNDGSNTSTNSSNSTSNNSNNGGENTTRPNEEDKGSGDNEPEKVETVTIAINAQKAIDYGIRNEAGFSHLPANGVILNSVTVEIKEGDTVYDVLAKVVRDNKIHMEYTGAASAIYIQGIDNLYEFDCGQYSGWMYEVNGVYPNYGVGGYTVKPGDKITFNYTCDLGKDLGAPVN